MKCIFFQVIVTILVVNCYGIFQEVLHSTITCDHDRTLNLDVTKMVVYLYDFLLSSESFNLILRLPIREAARGILHYEDLDKSKRFIFYTGGFRSLVYNENTQKIKETFKDYQNSYLIIFDHSVYTNGMMGEFKGYEISVKYAYYIGKAIGSVLSDLRFGGISSKNIHCVGHGLGSHIFGHAGVIYHKNTGEKLWRITGLDPAGPCYTNSDPEEQLRKGVAEYVEIYHCNTGGLRTSSVLGDIDFFVNTKGEFLPNCYPQSLSIEKLSVEQAHCSHKACISIWAASVANRHWYPAEKCNSFENFSKGICASNEITTAGFWNPGNATGLFYFSIDGFYL